MKRVVLPFALVLSCALMASGCYVATVDMKKPAGEVHQQQFAPSWLYGLVPPPTVDGAALCPNGLSKVETQHSFLNYLVTGVTFGIFTPIQITVTCAAAPGADLIDPDQEILIPAGASNAVIKDMYSRAAERAVATGKPVWVRFDH
jgi:hypothetical protein